MLAEIAAKCKLQMILFIDLVSDSNWSTEWIVLFNFQSLNVNAKRNVGSMSSRPTSKPTNEYWKCRKVIWNDPKGESNEPHVLLLFSPHPLHAFVHFILVAFVFVLFLNLGQLIYFTLIIRTFVFLLRIKKIVCYAVVVGCCCFIFFSFGRVSLYFSSYIHGEFSLLMSVCCCLLPSLLLLLLLLFLAIVSFHGQT